MLWLIPALPFASAFVLLLFGPRFSRRATAAVGVGSIGLSALITILVAINFVGAPPAGNSYTQVLWAWIHVAGFEPHIGLYLDALSLVMVLVVTFVAFLIHIYSAGFMIADECYSRFFAYMNLFVSSMITLLLGDNLLLLLLGWEGVGLCSYNAFGLLGGEANAIAPGKRPLSSMAPTIVLKGGAPYLVTGSPGGSTIITVVLQELLNVLTYDMNVAEATAAARIHHQWQPDVVISERGVSDDTLRILESRGFIIPKNGDGGFQHRVLGRTNSIMKANGYFLGAADTRDPDGAAIGY